MGTRKLIYVPNDQIWRSIQHAAKLNWRSASNYLIWLHDRYLLEHGMTYESTAPMPDGTVKLPNYPHDAHFKQDPVLEVIPVHRENEEMHRTGDYPPFKEEGPVFVDSEEADRNPDKYPVGAIVTVPEGHESIIKKPAVVPKTVEEVKEKIEEILEKKPDKFFSPYSKDHQTRKKKK